MCLLSGEMKTWEVTLLTSRIQQAWTISRQPHAWTSLFTAAPTGNCIREFLERQLQSGLDHWTESQLSIIAARRVQCIPVHALHATRPRDQRKRNVRLRTIHCRCPRLCFESNRYERPLSRSFAGNGCWWSDGGRKPVDEKDGFLRQNYLHFRTKRFCFNSRIFLWMQ